MTLSKILQEETREALFLVKGSDLLAFAEDLIAQRTTPTPSDPDEPISQADAMELFGKSRQAFYTWRKKGLITAYSVGGRLYYKKSELLDALKKV